VCRQTPRAAAREQRSIGHRPPAPAMPSACSEDIKKGAWTPEVRAPHVPGVPAGGRLAPAAAGGARERWGPKMVLAVGGVAVLCYGPLPPRSAPDQRG
jgi:hypothetical protein